MFAAKNELLTRPSGYNISRSLRFRSSASAYLSRTPASATNQTTWTWSGWVKRGDLGRENYLFGATTDNYNVNWSVCSFNPSNNLYVQGYASSSQYNVVTTAVFRDVSAWYHIVIAFDTTQATNTNRIKLYVNGVLQSVSATYPSQNLNTFINRACNHTIGGTSSSYTHDGYQAEVNFIDGQALTPSSFGAFDTNGVWQPARYTGSYGTNGFYLPFSDTASTTQNFLTYSEQFDNAAWSKTNVTVTANSVAAPNGATVADTVTENTATDEHYTEQIYTKSASSITYTYSAYVKSNGRNYCIIVRGPSSANNATIAVDTSTGAIILSATASGTFSSASGAVQSVGNGWYRVSITFTSDTGTTLYIRNYGYNGASAYTGNGSSGFYIWGAQLQASSSVGPYIVTSATAQTTATTNLGADYQISGGGWNNWLSNNISVTSGTTYDSMIDSPTNYADGGNGRGNYCVINPLDNGGLTIQNGNLSVYQSGVSNWLSVRSTIGVNTGKWYFEFIPNASPPNYTMLGVTVGSASLATHIGVSSNGYGYNAFDGYLYTNNGGGSYGSAFGANDVIGVALDISAGKIWFSKNGTWQASGNPATGSNPASSGLSTANTYFPAMSSYNGTVTTDINFGQRPFAYTPPSGFSALNTQNLP